MQPNQNALAVYPHPNDYSYKDLLGENLSGKDLRGAWSYQSQLDHAVLNSVNASGVSFVGASLVRSHLRHAKLTGAYFNYADLTEADFTGADLRKANFLQAKLLRARFQGANFARAELTAADLRQADLRGADLCFVQGPLYDARNADNTSHRLFSVNLQGAIYDQATRWPRHMRPQAFGAVYVQEARSASGTPPVYNGSPYKAHWGPYTITVVRLGEIGRRFCILNAQGAVLREVRSDEIDALIFLASVHTGLLTCA